MIPEHYTGPGLVDLQLNGYAGFDFNSNPDIWTVDDFYHVKTRLRQRGVLHALPTFITDDPDRMVKRAETYRKLVETHPDLLDTFPGLHIEGPFISPDDGPRGAHPRVFCSTPEKLPDLLYQLQEASGSRVKILTLAPELTGAIPLIEEATHQNIDVALGHTNADAETIRQAVDSGASISTHLGNGSHQILPRLDNYVQCQLAEDRLSATFIADGHHMPFTTLKNFIRAKTPARSVLVTDAIAAADKGPGRYWLGGGEVVVTEDLCCRRPGAAHLAGSALTLDRAVLNVAMNCDVSFEQAWHMASTRPAAILNLNPPADVSVFIREGRFVLDDKAAD